MTALKALLVLGILQATYALSEKDLCEILPDKTSFRHTHSCTKYFTCIDKKPIAATCLEGFYFDKTAGKCNVSKEVKCDADLNNRCTKNSIYLADPESCHHYYICINGKAQQVACPTGSNYNPETSSCMEVDDYKCQLKHEYNPCDVVAQQVLFKHDKDCKKYRVCTEDKTIVDRSCPGSLWFDALTGKCDTESKAQCGGPAPLVEPIPVPENGDTCGTPSRPYVGLVHDGLTCRGYYNCEAKYDANGKKQFNAAPVYKVCNKNEIFDEKAKKCVPRQQAKCRFDRCHGWGNEYVNVEGDGCHGYAICENNKEVMRMKCPEKYYFDEIRQDCVTSVVNYPSCVKKA